MAVDLSSRRDSDCGNILLDEDRDSPETRGIHDTSNGSISADGDDVTNRSTTPSRGRRKNKRKMSEPRRLGDFLEKRSRLEEEDSGVESNSAPGSADRSPVVDDSDSKIRDSNLYAPPIIVPAYLPYPYTFMNANMSSLQSLQLMNSGHGSGIPAPSTSLGVTNTFSQSKPGSSSRKSKRKVREESPDLETNVDSSAGSPVQSDALLDDDARRQYKTMTVERRVEANARERTRVHTISAAFEALRRAVPAYSYNQKLSKLAILRIACCYILSLSRLADKDYSRDQSRPSFRECVELTTRTIQAEGRAKKRH